MSQVDGRSRTSLSLVERQADARFYGRQAAQRGQGPTLVLGCANGRIAFDLCAHSQQVVAVDPSEVMVHAAEERRQAESAALAERLRFIEADLRSLRLPERFSLVLAPQNALGLMGSLEDLDALFATARHHLQEGGTLAFDVLNPRGEPRPRDDEELPPLALPEPLRPVFAPHLRERRRGPGREELKAIRRLRLRQFSPDEVDAALEHNGFVALERYGDFEGKPFEREDPLQVVVAGLT
jgi:SAM-dependent methyltransferase